MPAEIFYPFSVSKSGGISVTADPDLQVNQHVNALLETEPGERRMQYAYGVPTRSLLFEPGAAILGVQIADQVRAKMATYEPGVLITGVEFDSSDDHGLAQIRLGYSRRESPLTSSGIAANTNVAVINVGGTVDEVVRG